MKIVTALDGQHSPGPTMKADQAELRRMVVARVAALLTISIWASTYISIKLLNAAFSPLSIMVVRFVIGALFLNLLSPPFRKKTVFKEELPYIVAGFLGIFLYYYLENLATSLTHASNVAIIVSTIPILTTFLASFRVKAARMSLRHTASLGISFFGVLIIVFGSGTFAGMSPAGDGIALLAALAFSCYTLFLRKLGGAADGLRTARKTVTWGALWTVSAALLFGDLPVLSQVFKPEHAPHFLFLGLFASGFCFILWSRAVADLGPGAASKYIFFVPVISIVLSAALLREAVTPAKIVGIVLIIAGSLRDGARDRRVICPTDIPDARAV